jgi:biotin-(acetyl-CoA carboxylase) ligase
MPSEPRIRSRTPFTPALDLPPVYTAVALREVGDAFAHAREIAGEAGAGTLVYVGRFDLAEFAVVLEPDEPLRSARRAFHAGMVALVDALLFYSPPERKITIDWPGTISIEGGLVGGGQLAWPADAREDAVPDWLVFGGMIRMVSLADGEPGLRPLSTALEDEGFDDAAATRLVESFARHLMVATDAWQEQGFRAVEREYLQRLARENGVRRSIDENGDLLTRRTGKTEVERLALVPALTVPAWLDPETRGPRL